MSIRLTPSASNSRTKQYLATKTTLQAIKRPIVVDQDCCFCFPNCDWDLPAFAFLSDSTNTYKNDRTDFIVNVPLNGTVEATLIQLDPDNNVLQSISIVNDTYGLLFPIGTIKSNVWGFILDWYKVADVESLGRWKLNLVVKNSAGLEMFNQDSACFHLRSYTCQMAHRTVKIKTEQSGYFEGGFDYTNINFTIEQPNGKVKVSNSWPQEIRLYGRFFREGRDFEIDNIVTKDRGQQLIQSKTVKRYLLKLDTIPTSISNRLVDDMLQAPEIYLNDYQINAIELYDNVRVTLTELPDPENFTQNINEFMDIRFAEWKQNNVHRFK